MSRFKKILFKIVKPANLALAIVLFAAVVAIILLFDQVVMPWYTKHGEAIEMPNTVAKRYEEAKEILESKDLEVVKAGEKHDSSLPFGYVAEQNPRASRKVKKGRRVYLTISAGEREIPVPDLIGISETNAVQRLKSTGLRVGEIVYEYVSGELSGAVIKQSQPPGTLIKSSQPIDITVSLGSPTDKVTVPDLFGKTLNEAKRAISKSGLNLGRVTYKVSNSILPNTVLKQSLEPGEAASFGDVIDLVVTTVSRNGND